jgi:type VI secretion system protein ImpH
LEDYERLLPGGVSFPRLVALVRGYAGDALDWDANLILHADEVPRARLGGATRLGLTGWLGERPSPRDADDLMLSTMAATTQ